MSLATSSVIAAAIVQGFSLAGDRVGLKPDPQGMQALRVLVGKASALLDVASG
jgi:hypothetical protein